MNNNIYPCLWFDGKAEEAAKFYCSVFNNSTILSSSSLVSKFKLEGKEIMGLNGGPMFKINPSISFFVVCESTVEIEKIFSALMENGSAMMQLDTYPWSEKYAWVVDQFGMTWQLMLGKLSEHTQKISLSFLFVGDQFGKAASAIDYYVQVFPQSSVIWKEMYTEVDGLMNGNLKYGSFLICNDHFSAMDGSGQHEFGFNEAVSIVLECKDQQEIDYYWALMTSEGSESMCGWLKDKYGISWQIIPKQLAQLMSDKSRSQRVMKALLKMKKLNIEELESA